MFRQDHGPAVLDEQPDRLQIELHVPAIGAQLRADLDWERGAALGLRDGEDVFLSLRQARVFAHGRHDS